MANVLYHSRKQVYVKSSCNDINIFDVDTILPWIFACLHRHRKRYDFKALLIRVGGMSKAEYQASLYNSSLLIEPAKRIAEEAIRRIKAKDLQLKPVQVKQRVDHSSGKVRDIGCEDAMQQIFDAIAVGGADAIFRRRVVAQQWSSVKGRGPSYGVRTIKRWIDKDNRSAAYAKKHGLRYVRKCRFFVKGDIKQCYKSIRIDDFLRLFRKDCRNNALFWLWSELLHTFPDGLLIGSAISQWAAQYILSFLYRYVMSLCRYRRGKRINDVNDCGMYMDDFLLVGSSYAGLKHAMKQLTIYAKREFGLTIKPNWQICRLDDTPIDMMGYLIYSNGKVAVRPRIFLRARRIALRTRKTMAYRQAQRLVSYKGYFQQKNLSLSSYKMNHKYNLNKRFLKAQKLVSERTRYNGYTGLQQCSD